MRTSFAFSLRLAAVGLLIVCPVFATIGGGAASADDQHPLEPANTASPRDTLESFISSGHEVYTLIKSQGGTRSASKLQAEGAIRNLLSCLDLSEEPAYLKSSTAKRSAVCLLEVFDRIELPASDEIPGREDIDSGDEPLASWRIPHTEITIHRVAEGPRQGEYLFSPATVAEAPDYYQRVKHLPYKTDAAEDFYEWFLSEPGVPWMAAIVHQLPGWLKSRYFGQAIWQWIGLLLTLVTGAAAMVAAYAFGRQRALLFRDRGGLRLLATLWAPALALVVPILLSHVVERYLVISGTTLVVVQFAANIVFLIAVMVVIVSICNRIADVIISLPRIHPRGIDAQFIRIISRIIGLVISIVVFLEGGQYLGIPLTTLLAGAGVGGLTIALAAQDTLRNIFGSMMILLDKPFRVGERIVAQGYDGVVQEIGLRSTRLQLLTGHEATIPNDQLARTDIENIGRRPHIRRSASLALPFYLPLDKCQKAVDIIRDILTDHEGQHEDFPPRVFLNEFNRDSFNVLIMYWYHPPNYWDFMAFSQAVNLEIKRRFEAEEIPFALPTQRNVLTRDDESSVDKSNASQASD